MSSRNPQPISTKAFKWFLVVAAIALAIADIAILLLPIELLGHVTFGLFVVPFHLLVWASWFDPITDRGDREGLLEAGFRIEERGSARLVRVQEAAISALYIDSLVAGIATGVVVVLASKPAQWLHVPHDVCAVGIIGVYAFAFVRRRRWTNRHQEIGTWDLLIDESADRIRFPPQTSISYGKIGGPVELKLSSIASVSVDEVDDGEGTWKRLVVYVNGLSYGCNLGAFDPTREERLVNWLRECVARARSPRT